MENSDDDGGSDESYKYWLGFGIALLSAWTMGFNGIYNRKLKSLGPNIVMFYHGVIGTSLGGIILIIEAIIRGGFRTFDAGTYGILAAGGLIDTLCVNCLTVAFMNDRSGFVSLMSYMLVFWGFLADILIFKEEIGLLEFLGAMVVLLATLVVSVIKVCQ